MYSLAPEHSERVETVIGDVKIRYGDINRSTKRSHESMDRGRLAELLEAKKFNY